MGPADDRFTKWKPSYKFIPTTNDLSFVRPGIYAHETKMSLITRWRDTAEKETLNFILLLLMDEIK